MAHFFFIFRDSTKNKPFSSLFPTRTQSSQKHNRPNTKVENSGISKARFSYVNVDRVSHNRFTRHVQRHELQQYEKHNQGQFAWHWFSVLRCADLKLNWLMLNDEVLTFM